MNECYDVIELVAECYEFQCVRGDGWAFCVGDACTNRLMVVPMLVGWKADRGFVIIYPDYIAVQAKHTERFVPRLVVDVEDMSNILMDEMRSELKFIDEYCPR